MYPLYVPINFDFTFNMCSKIFVYLIIISIIKFISLIIIILFYFNMYYYNYKNYNTLINIKLI